MFKIILCFGTRPEAIKMAPVIQELKKQKIFYKVCVTAQHREMLDQVLEFFEILPDYDLNLMESNQTLNKLSGRILFEMDRIFEAECPDLVLVQGDTTTSAIVSLAAFNCRIKVGHIEAGLRTYNKLAPFPEELNRQLTTRIADIHFAPTAIAFSNLLKEQISQNNICLTGNTVVDALKWSLHKIKTSSYSEEIEKLNKLLNSKRKLILVTGHRRENFGDGINKICEALKELSNRDDVEILYPIHLNPNISKPVKSKLDNNNNIHLVPPVSYPTMLWLLQRSTLIISDSGGVQEEAPAFKKPVVVTREVTERMEGFDAGFSFLVGIEKQKIVATVVHLLENPPNYDDKENPYGDGNAARKIVTFLINFSMF